jgi:hypothetical protein
MLTAGVDIVDIGGQSTRPGAEVVSEAEELDRVIPVIECVCDAYDFRYFCETISFWLFSDRTKPNTSVASLFVFWAQFLYAYESKHMIIKKRLLGLHERCVHNFWSVSVQARL